MSTRLPLRKPVTELNKMLLLLLIMLSGVPGFSQEIPESGTFQSLNGTWAFKTDLYNKGVVEKWYGAEYQPAGWDTMAVPGVWDTRNEYAHYTGPAWYRKAIDVPAAWEGKAVRLYFEAVYNDVQVWLNGEEIGEHHIGFLPFQFDITGRLRYGETNYLVLRVDNTFKRGAIWNWGGIRRPVHLEVTDKARLEYQHITAVPDLEKGTASIGISFLASNIGEEDRQLAYKLELFDTEGPVQFSGKKEGTLKIGARDSVMQELSLHMPGSSVRLWHFNHPHLYTSKISLLSGGKVIHSVTDRFGIRKIEVDGESLKLNGEPVRTVGFNLVPEDRVHGSTLPLSRIMEDVDMMKSLGANMARLSHLPLHREFLDYLDEKGIMTFEEVSLWGRDVMVDPEAELPRYWLKTMIRHNYNHPSIIGWSVGNEIGHIGDHPRTNPKAMEYVESATRHARTLDPHRLAVYVSNSAARQKTDPVEFSDIILYNAYGNWGRGAERTHENHPGKPIFFSEYGDQLNDEDPNLGRVDIRGMLAQMQGKRYLAGASLWTFNDYRSFFQRRDVEGWSTPPSENRTWGVVNVFRQPKRAYYEARRAYAPVKDLQVRHSRERFEPGASITSSVRLFPRDKYDIPAYEMENYKLVWELLSVEGKLIEGDYEQLPLIRPGDSAVESRFSWKVPLQDVQSLKIALLDPQNYEVYDTIIYLAKPPAPKLLSTHSSRTALRLVFEKPPAATAVKARYGVNGLSRETGETINDFIDIDSLEQGETYQVQLIALNNSGESGPSETVSITTDEEELPPVIWKTVPVDGGFFTGYAVNDDVYLYEIQYGTRQGDFGNFHTIPLRNVKGVCQIPGLENGKTYYYRMRWRTQWGFASEWTREIAVTPGRDLLPLPPEPVGVIRNGTEALLVFQPAEKATGYDIRYTDQRTGKTFSRRLNASQVNYVSLDGLEKKGIYTFEIAAAGTGGRSGFASFNTSNRESRAEAYED